MMRLLMVSALLASSLFPQSEPPQHPITSQRTAAVRFAIENGFEIPRTNIVVALETLIQGGRFRSTTLFSSQERGRDAEELARLVGPTVRTVRAQDVLSCPESRCYASTNLSVLAVEGPFTDPPGTPHGSESTGIYIKVYSPERSDSRAKLYNCVVDTERRGSDWFGTRFRVAPNSFIVK